MNTKLHAVTDSVGCPIGLLLAADQMSAYVGAVAPVWLCARGGIADRRPWP
jgi:hypothetical protein